MADAGRDALSAVVEMQELLTASGSATRVLLASIRDLSSVVALARHGVTHFTMKPGLAEEFFTDDLTAQAVRDFEKAIAATAS